MTTPVIISTLGIQPDREVHIHTIGRDEHGEFKRGEFVPHVLRANQCVQLYLHDGVQLEVHEHRIVDAEAQTEGASS